jgi:hypothetical protein
MKRKNLLTAGGLIGAIIVLVISSFIFPIASNNNINSTVNSNSTTKNSIFDNSTPEATATSIARLNEGTGGFDIGDDMITNAYLTSDGRYWIVKMHQDGYDDWIVTVDAKTLMSKKNGGYEKPINTWRSLDELKALYIAEIQTGDAGVDFGRPHNVTLEGKTVWKVPVYTFLSKGWELSNYIYVDLATGKSEFVDLTGKTEGWKTLKQIDDTINKKYDTGPEPFRNALRDLYPE